MIAVPFLATRRRVSHPVALIAALVAALLCEDFALATPPGKAESEETLLAQAPPRRRRERTRAARRRRRRRRHRRPSKPEKTQTVEVSRPPKATEKTAWGLDLGLGVQRLHVLYTSDIFGRFAWPGCDTRPEDKAEMGHLIAAVTERTKQIHGEGGGVPLVVSAGSMTRPDVLGNFVFKDETLAPIAAELIKRVRFDGVAVGMFDFGVAPDAFRRYLQLMRRANVPLLAGNVTCKEASDFPCSHLGQRGARYVVVDRGGLKIGVFGVVREDLVKRILGGGGKGISAKEVVESARATIRTLRSKEKVDFIVALAAVNVEGDTPVPSLEFVRRLGEDAPEVVIADTMFERGLDNYMAQLRRASGPVILGTDRFGQTMGEAIIYYRRDKGRVRIDHIGIHKHRTIHSKPATEDVARAKTLLDGMCRVLDRTISGARFTQPMTYPGFMGYALKIMRQHTEAEIALLNESAVADTSFPMSGKLTEEKLLRAIRTEAKVGTVWLTGSRLKELLANHIDDEDSDLFIVGVTHENGDWKVNDRALLPGNEYLVATTAFVASGGDLLVNITEDFRSTPTSLRDMVIDFFKEGGARYDGDPAIDGERDFPVLGNEWLLSMSLNSSTGLYSVHIKNGPHSDRYFRPVLTTDREVTFSIDIRLDFLAESRSHVFEAAAQGKYKKSFDWWYRWDPEIHRPTYATNIPDGGMEYIDEFTFRLGYRSRFIRSLVGFDRWWAPEPFIEGMLITEFTSSGIYPVPNPTPRPPPPDDADWNPFVDKGYHYLDMVGTVGIGMVLHPLFFPKIGFVWRSELLTPEEANVKHGIAAQGLYLGYMLRRWKILESSAHPLEIESRADFYFTNLLSRRRAELTAQTKLLFGITRVLYFSLDHYFFLIDVHREDISVANIMTAGLTVLLDYRHQTF